LDLRALRSAVDSLAAWTHPKWLPALAAVADGTEAVPPRPAGQGTFKLWQRNFWDTQLRSRDHYDEKWSYVRLNPVRKGLAGAPEDWPYQGEVFSLAWR